MTATPHDSTGTLVIRNPLAGDIPSPVLASRVRGMLLGLAIGDTLGSTAGAIPTRDPLRAGVATQLAAFTTEGLIRSQVRGNAKGITHQPTMVWHAHRRWAHLQDLHHSHGLPVAGQDLDGWLPTIPALAQRRGTAKATIAALSHPTLGTAQRSHSTSGGAHAVTNTLPAAALVAQLDPGALLGEIEALVFLTHGDAMALHGATTTGLWAAGCLLTGDLQEALAITGRLVMGSYAGFARDTATPGVPNPEFWTHPSLPDLASGVGAMTAAIHCTHTYPQPDDALTCVQEAARHGGSTIAAITGAILGASHGIEVWPAHLIARHELGWVLDTLARDLFDQLTTNPAGTEYTAAPDPHWHTRYPGY